MFARTFQLTLLLLSPSAFAQEAGPAPALAPWKDELFALPATLTERDGGAYRIVNYQSTVAINQRDAIPERKVRDEYVSSEPLALQKDRRVKTKAGYVSHFTVGATEGVSIITLYIHGKGGNREQGVDDATFGGNFNRLKNLMVRNNGLYISPDFESFTGRGAKEIGGLILHYKSLSPNAKVIVAAGSAGGRILYQLARDREVAPHLSGLLFLGSFSDSGYMSSLAFQNRVPVYIGHGSADYISLVQNMENFYRALRERDPSYPTRMVRFATGTHGTPIRMTDWRETINWMLSAPR